MILVVKKSRAWLLAIFLLPGIISLEGFGQPVELVRDSTVGYGKLNNGFMYYVKNNNDSSKMISILFVVRAGFLQEDEDQKEVAHLVEHVAGRGTANYQKGVVPYLEPFGSKPGRDLNASTSYDHTSFRLNVPSENNDALSTALKIARDIATNVLFDSVVMFNEREAVMAEAMRASGLEQRETDIVLPAILGKSFYARRGIGTNGFARLKLIKDERIEKFYKDWYRPELQAIVISGNIDTGKVVAEVRRLFSSIPKVAGGRDNIKHKLYAESNEDVFVFPDAERNEITIKLYSKFEESEPIINVGDLRNLMMRELYSELIKQRFSELRDGPNLYLKRAACTYNINGLNGLVGMDVLQATSRFDSLCDVEPGMKVLVGEIKRIEKWGFLEDEIRRGKLRLENRLSRISEIAAGSDVGDFLNHLLYGDTFMETDHRKKVCTGMIESLTVDEINRFSQALLRRAKYDIVLLVPDSKKDSLPSKETVRSYLNVNNSSLARYSPRKLKIYHPSRPAHGDTVKILSKKNLMGITEIVLGNGVRLVLKQLEGENDKIGIYAFSKIEPGVYSKKDHYSVRNCASIVSEGGIKRFTKSELDAFLKSSQMSVDMYTDNFSAGIRSSAKAAEAETLISLIRQYFDKPSENRRAFSEWINRQRTISTNSIFYYSWLDTINRAIGDHPFFISNKELDLIDFSVVYKTYTELFSDNAASFTFIVTGGFDEAKIVPLLTAYLGTLKTKLVHSEKNKKTQLTAEDDPVFHKVSYNNGLGSDVFIEFRGVARVNYSTDLTFNCDFWTWFLNKRLFDKLRQGVGGTYDVNVNYKVLGTSLSRIIFSIGFRAIQEKANALKSATLTEIAKIRAEGIRDEDVANYLASTKEHRNTSINSRSYWNDFIFNSFFYGGGLVDVPVVYEFAEKGVDPSRLNSFFNIVFDENKFSDFMALPKTN